MNAKLKRLIIFILMGLWMTKTAIADPAKIDQLRKTYAKHGLDFFGELIADQENYLADEKKFAKVELLADNARVKALRQLEKILKKVRGSRLESELLIRKAKLLSERARTANFFKNNPYKTRSLKSEKYYLSESIRTYKIVERKFPRDGRMDVVLFSIAYNYQELQKTSQAYDYYTRLVVRYPDSDLIGDARLARAEIYFKRRQFSKSVKELQKIVDSEHPRLKNFAQYKMAWSYYNLKKLGSAIGALEKTIAGVNEKSVQRARLELRREALHDLVVFYSEKTNKDSPQAAPAYFAEIAKTPSNIFANYEKSRKNRNESRRKKGIKIPKDDDDEYQMSEPHQMLTRLTQRYSRDGKHKASRIVAKHLISSLGDHARAPALHQIRIESAEKLRDRNAVVQDIRVLAKRFQGDIPEASDRNEKEESAYIKNLSSIGFEILKKYSTYYHREWKKTQGKKTAERALNVYDIAVESLLTPWRGHKLKDCLQIRAQRADLRFATSRFALAAEDYKWLTFYTFENQSNEKKYLKKATNYSRNEVAAIEAELRKKRVRIKKGDFHPVHEKLSQAYNRYLSLNLRKDTDKKLPWHKYGPTDKTSYKTIDKTKTVAQMVSASARLHREYGHHEEALLRQQFYSVQWPKGAEALDNTKDVLNSLEKLTRWEDLADFSKALLDKKSYKSSSIHKDLLKTYEYSSLKILEKWERLEKWKKAVRGFSEFAETHPSSKFAPQALMKAAYAATKVGKPVLIVKKLEAASKAKNAKISLQAWLALEPYYRKGFQWDKLVVTYSKILQLPATSKQKASARRNLHEINKLKRTPGTLKIPHDKALAGWLRTQNNFQKSVKRFKSLRFKKSNNNPQANFKKKADLHQKLSSRVDKLATKAPSSLQMNALLWQSLTKAELLVEFGETLENAALPSILKQATDADRKAYKETIQANANELFDQARDLTETTLKMVEKADSPISYTDRINNLCAKLKINKNVQSQKFKNIWGDRPKIKLSKSAKLEEVRELGFDIIEEEAKEDQREYVYELAQKYLELGKTGYAVATLNALHTDLNSGTDKYTGLANTLQFQMDLNRLPSSLESALKAKKFNTKTKWQFARWLASYTVDCSDKGFDEDECEWFESAVHTLLRSKVDEGLLSAN